MILYQFVTTNTEYCWLLECSIFLVLLLVNLFYLIEFTVSQSLGDMILSIISQ